MYSVFFSKTFENFTYSTNLTQPHKTVYPSLNFKLTYNIVACIDVHICLIKYICSEKK